MLDLSLNYIVHELNSYLPSDGPPKVVMGNIAFMESEEQSEEIKDKVVVSLINIEEESTLKNGKNFSVEGTSVKYYHRPVHLNLYILFAANYGNDKYEQGLGNLSKVIEYFQSHRVITHLNSPLPGQDDVQEIELCMELFALSFEQVNYVWGSLGGKQVPFVLYKGRLVAIKADKTNRVATLLSRLKQKRRHINGVFDNI
ncbi:MAG: DUF4255 domain-containing protein [Bacteroidales bacterium]|nr:DUF4255 domain-containing protein [Bacteroidales bacterium]